MQNLASHDKMLRNQRIDKFELLCANIHPPE